MENTKPWLAQYQDDVDHTIAYSEKPLHYFLREAAQKSPAKTALYFLGKKMTFAEVYEQSLRFANYLCSLGLKKGDRVAIMLPNCPQTIISYYGILLAGGIVVPTNPMYTERELSYQINDSGAKIIVCLEILYPRVINIKKETPLEHIIVTKIKDYLPFPKNLIYPFIQKKNYNIVVNVKATDTTHLFPNIMQKSKGKTIEVSIQPKEDLALLQYTGGTTGPPKGVMLTHYNLVCNTEMCIHWLQNSLKQKENIILGILPFFHVFGMTCVMNYSILSRSTMILLPKFDPLQTLKTIHTQKPTLFPGAPTIYISLLNHPKIAKYNLSSIESCISGSAPLPLEVQENFEQVTGGKLVEGYGLTEAAPVTHANFIDRPVKGSIGVPWPDTEAMILSLKTGKEAAIHEIGELLVRGPQVMKGYWGKEEETASVFHEGNWLKTGDLAYMDEKGYFYIVDRIKDMIIAGGYNIYPREIEEVLYEHEAVQEAAAVGIADSYRGETVKAYIVIKENKKVTIEELDAHCRKYLAAYKVPKMYEFKTELPKTTIGKVLRRTLIEEEEKKRENEKRANDEIIQQ